ncbi:MAG: hypothetical protein EBU90_29475 [Proteobacteria bacterium]|nr:hypothetical protein [Pseudomonadota bacterium]
MQHDAEHTASAESETDMTYRIIKQHWQGCTHLIDSRQDIRYAYQTLNGAKHICGNDIGEECFTLTDGRTAWLISTDIEQVEPLHDNYLREPYGDAPYCYEVWWCAAGCLYDSDHPAFSADTLEEIEAWLQSEEADTYREAAGEFSTYAFEIINTTTNKESD